MSSAFRSPAAILRFVLTAAIGTGLDLWTKSLAFSKLTLHGNPYVFIPGWVDFEIVTNHGAVFGFGQGARVLFIAVSAGAIVFLSYLFVVSGKRWVYQILLGMLMAGVLGNLYDRVTLGYVRDMIHALPMWNSFFPWVFNVADSFLCTGVTLMLIYSMVAEYRGKKEREIPRNLGMPMDDAGFMRRALDLAMRGRGRVEPNPMVGCVLVRDGQIIGEGYHEYFGGPHAEPNALAACKDATGATAYVTLEPCCHLNKKTPPCTRALIAAKIARVVGACEDANPSVSGRGFQDLRDAGIRVETGLLEINSLQLNAAYSKLISQRRPYVTLKWAQTSDGKIAGAGGRRLAISNARSLEIMHQLRSRCDAILVGIETVLADDPLLTARVNDPPRRPMRIVLDSNLRIGLESQLVKSAEQSRVLVYCAEAALRDKSATAVSLKARGVEVRALPADPAGGLSLGRLLDVLGEEKITHLLVEPGPKLARSFIWGNLADRVWIFRSPTPAEAGDAPAAEQVGYPISGRVLLDGDELSEYLNDRGSVFYSLEKSADLISATLKL